MAWAWFFVSGYQHPKHRLYAPPSQLAGKGFEDGLPDGDGVDEVVDGWIV
jgi:hypothetical protein